MKLVTGHSPICVRSSARYQEVSLPLSSANEQCNCLRGGQYVGKTRGPFPSWFSQPPASSLQGPALGGGGSQSHKVLQCNCWPTRKREFMTVVHLISAFLVAMGSRNRVQVLSSVSVLGQASECSESIITQRQQGNRAGGCLRTSFPVWAGRWGELCARGDSCSLGLWRHRRHRPHRPPLQVASFPI
jgi:hypothetical protein